MNIKIHLSSFDYKILKWYRNNFSKAEINVLLSYGTTNADYFSMIVEDRSIINSLILDSGAFSLNNKELSDGKPITLDGFIEYCKTFKDYLDFIFNFDEDFTLFGYETNYKNQKQLEAEGVNVIPVVHDYIGEEVKELDEYINNYDLISLGFSKHKSDKKHLKNTVLKIKNSGKKVHLLGVNAYKIIKDLPLDYNDSSNWAQGQIFGFMYYWNAKNNPNDPELTLRFRDFEPDRTTSKGYFEDSPYFEEILTFLKEELGITYRNLYGQNSTFYRQIVNTHYFVKLQDYVREAHKANCFDTLYP